MPQTSSILEVSPSAAERIRQFAREGNISDITFRVDVVGGAESGFAYDLSFDRVEPDDEVFVSRGIRVAVRRDCVKYLVGSSVEWIEGDNGAGFQVVNPNEPEK